MQARATKPREPVAAAKRTVARKPTNPAYDRQSANSLWGQLATLARPTIQRSDGPTLGNLYPEDAPRAAPGRVKLEKVGERWYETVPGRERRRAKGLYNVVVRDDGIHAVKVSRRAGADTPGHADLAGGRRSKWAGTIKFGQSKNGSGVIRSWSNASGHFAPSSSFAANAGLPMDKYVPHSGPRAPRGPQLPVFQPNAPQGPPTAGGGATPEAPAPKTVLGGSATPEAPAPKTVPGGGAASGPTAGRVGASPPTPGRLRGMLGKLGRVAKAGGKALIVLGPVFEVVGMLQAFSAAKAQITALAKYRDAIWDAVLAELDEFGRDPTSDVVDTAVASPTPTVPAVQDEPLAATFQSARVFDVSKHKLTSVDVMLPSGVLTALYSRIAFASLTDVDESIYRLPLDQIDCRSLRAGLQSLPARQFEGYAAIGDQRELRDLLPSQLRLIRLSCLLQAIGRGLPPAKDAAPRPDGDYVTATLQWMDGIAMDEVTATCAGPDAGGQWRCDVDGDIEGLKEATVGEVSPDYVLMVDVQRVVQGQPADWSYSLTSWIENWDHPAPEPHASFEGSLPPGTCDEGTYPAGSALAFILENYGSRCLS